MKKIFLSIAVTAALLGSVFAATRAFFSDTETSAGNLFQAGTIDLKVDNQSYYNGVLSESTTWELDDLPGHLFFNFDDLKPGDLGEDTISLHVLDNEAWACANISLTKNDDNTCTQPESEDDPSCLEPDADTADGELAQNVNFVFWVDDGDNVLEDDETGENILAQGPASTALNASWTLADSTGNKFGLPTGEGLQGTTTYYIGKAWCFGNLTLAPLAQDNGSDTDRSPATTTGGVTCDGTQLDDATQSDIVNADISFSVVQHRNNPNFVCNPGTPTPTATATPTVTPTASPTSTPIACVESFASSSFFPNQGTQKSGAAVLANRSIPSAMFGAPQTTGTPSDAGFPAGSFYSLGFKLSPSVPGEHGSIVVGFASPFFPNPSGSDLQVFEVTGGVYPDEKVKVEVSSASTGPWTLVSAAATRDAALELPGSVLSAQFVRLTDVSDISLFPTDADAYDVDAVKVFCSTAL